ncbi:hypothetical protein BC937DRAFT_92625 [Endogone sp. FLAS-F59071]|nr:hypothetical protein BC937DRAFT_92625 [Endogone sp. FLAS-F59071]|eukprot:RUS21460.1 hypothetical protein BC937DRAFT_92625 [Endogone sp. FLAS-F59071]
MHSESVDFLKHPGSDKPSEAMQLKPIPALAQPTVLVPTKSSGLIVMETMQLYSSNPMRETEIGPISSNAQEVHDTGLQGDFPDGDDDNDGDDDDDDDDDGDDDDGDDDDGDDDGAVFPSAEDEGASLASTIADLQAYWSSDHFARIEQELGDRGMVEFDAEVLTFM